MKQEVVFKKAKPNHYYAKRNELQQLELVTEPEKGEKYYEFPAVSGG